MKPSTVARCYRVSSFVVALSMILSLIMPVLGMGAASATPIVPGSQNPIHPNQRHNVSVDPLEEVYARAGLSASEAYDPWTDLNGNPTQNMSLTRPQRTWGQWWQGLMQRYHLDGLFASPAVAQAAAAENAAATESTTFRRSDIQGPQPRPETMTAVETGINEADGVGAAASNLFHTYLPAIFKPPYIVTVIIPLSGGILTAPEYGFTLIVPANYYHEQLRFRFTPSTPPTLPDRISTPYAFDLTAETLSGQPVTQFHHALTLVQLYDPTVLTHDPDAYFFAYQNNLGEWVDIPTTTNPDTFTAATDHFTSFAVLALIQGCDPQYGIGRRANGTINQNIINAYTQAGLSNCPTNNVQTPQPIGGVVYEYQEFSGGIGIVDNPNTPITQAFVLESAVWNVYEDKAGILGGPITEKQGSAPNHYIDENGNNFRGQEIWYFDYGFISLNNGLNWEAYQYYPQFLSLRVGWEPQPISPPTGRYHLSLVASFEPNPAAEVIGGSSPVGTANANVTLMVETPQGNTYSVSAGNNGPMNIFINDFTHYYFPTETLKIYLKAERNDGLIGYARCNYYEPAPEEPRPYFVIPTITYTLEYNCAGMGTVDNERPEIEILQVYGTKIPGSSRLSLSALFRITDDFGIATAEATISEGVIEQPLAPYFGSLFGSDVYAVVFTDVPENTPVTITVGATDNSGLSAEEQFQGYAVDGMAYGFFSCMNPCGQLFGYTGKEGNPVSTQTGYKTETFPLLYISGPGQANINITPVYNSVSVRSGIFGAAMSSDLETHLVPLYNPLVAGVEVVIGDGGRFRFVDNGNGTFTAVSQGNRDTLVHEGDGYLYTTHDQRRYRFDAAGRLLARLDRNGNAITYIYSGAQITAITTGDRVVTLTYNDDGYVETIAIGDKLVTLSYTDGVLTQIEAAMLGDYTLVYETRPIGEIIDERGEDFAYEAAQHLLVEMVTFSGRIKNRQTYDDQGRVISQTSSLEGTITFQYIQNPDGTRETHIYDAYGVPKIHHYNHLGQLAWVQNRQGFIESYFYDANYHLERKIDFNGEEWHYTRDANGNIIATDGPEGFHEEWVYNQFNQPTYRKDGDGHEWVWVYDAQGNLIEAHQPDPDFPTMFIEYDGRGLPIRILDYNGNEILNVYDPINGDLIRTRDGEEAWTILTYDQYGRLHTRLLPMGGLWRYEYDPNSDQLTDLFGPLSYHVQYIYNPHDHLLVREIDADGYSTEYQYDDYFRLTDTWDGEENQTEFTYGSMNELLQVINARGVITRYTYDHNRRVIKIEAAWDSDEQILLQFTYDGLGNVLFAINGEGRVTSSEYDGLSRLWRLVQNYVADGPINAHTNVITLFESDYRRNVTRVTNPLGDERVMTYDSVGRLVGLLNEADELTIYDHDGNGNLTLIRFPEENEIEMAYNGRNQLEFLWDGENFSTEYRYDGNGNLTWVIAPDLLETRHEYNPLDQRVRTTENYVFQGTVNGQQNVITQFVYSRHGDLLEVIDARGTIFTYEYDQVHRLIKATNPEGETVYEYDSVGNLLQRIDANEQEWLYVYDRHNRLIRDFDPEEHFAEYSYDKADNLIAVRDRRGHITATEYDGLNRPVRITAPAPLNYETVMGYDALGNLLTLTDGNSHTSQFVYDQVQRLTTRIDAEGFRQEYEYDQNGRLVLFRIPFADPTQTIEERYQYDGRDLLTAKYNGEDELTQYAYNSVGLLERMTENDAIVTRYGYDGLRRLNQVTLNFDPASPASGDKNVIFHYRYDGVGNLELIRDPLGHETTFQYNSLGSLIYERNPIGNEWFYGYDPVQNLTLRRDANGFTTLYIYYPDHQLQTIDYPHDPDVTYTYDENNNPLTMQDSLGTTLWVYDVLNRVTAVTDSLGRTVRYSYDALNRTQITYPDNRAVNYSYLDNNWLETATDPVGGVSQYSYDEAGRITDIDHPNNTYVTRTYDRANRLLTLGNYQDGGDILSTFAYTYDAAGQRTQATNTYGWRQPATVVENYSYDGLRRLIGVTDSIGMVASYGYDRAGNRTLWQTNDDPFGSSPQDGFTATYSYNAANQLMTATIQRTPPSQSEVITFTYDPNGNRINKLVDGNGADEGMEHRYDDENRLVSGYAYRVTGGGNINWQGETTIAYDGLGRRLVETYDPHSGGGGLKRTEYTFDGLDPIAEYDLWNNHQRNYYRGAGNQMIQMHHFPAGAPGQQYWYHHDGRQNIAGMTKHLGQSTHNYRYDAYGGVIPANGNFTQPHNEYTLTEKAYDDHTGLHYFGARYYDAGTAVWLTQDTYRGMLILPQSIHRYGYVHGNPTNYIDQDGYFAHILGGAVVGAFIGGALGGVGDIAGQLAQGKSLKEIEWDTVKASAVGGAVQGAICGGVAAATVGAGAAVCGIVGGVAGDVASKATSNYLDKEKSLGDGLWETLGESLITNSLTFGLSSKIPGTSKIFKKVGEYGVEIFVGTGTKVFKNVFDGDPCTDWNDGLGQAFINSSTNFLVGEVSTFASQKAFPNPYISTDSAPTNSVPTNIYWDNHPNLSGGGRWRDANTGRFVSAPK